MGGLAGQGARAVREKPQGSCLQGRGADLAHSCLLGRAQQTWLMEGGLP